MLAEFVLDILEEPHLEEVPNECEFLNQLKNICSCCDEASFTDAVQNFPESFDMGNSKVSVTFEDKKDLLNACIKHIALSSVAEEIRLVFQSCCVNSLMMV